MHCYLCLSPGTGQQWLCTGVSGGRRGKRDYCLCQVVQEWGEEGMEAGDSIRRQIFGALERAQSCLEWTGKLFYEG